MKTLCQTAITILLQEPNVVESTGIQYVIGDIHGQFHDLRNLLHNIIPHMGTNNYVFLGDYVDRGYNSIETICMLLAYKCLYPRSVVLIRGNHETCSLTKIYGFYDEVIKKYGNSEPWKAITAVFQYLPLAAVLQDQLLCLHGGLSPNIPYIDNIALIDRVREIPESGPMSDLVWSDPDATLSSWAVSNRGAGYLFPHQAVKEFLHINDIKTVARAHQLVEEGYIFNFGDESLVTVWSAPNYCYRCGNEASVMKMNEDGSHEFIKFQPSADTLRLNISYEYVLPYFL